MIVIADIHLGKTNDSFVIDGKYSQTLDIERRLRNVLARAKMTHQSIAVAGDVFNRVNPTTQAMAVLFAWLAQCKREEVRVYIIAGNHDAGVDWSSAVMLHDADLPNVTVITRPDMVLVSEGRGAEEYQRSVLFWPHMPLVEQEVAERGHGSVSKAVSSAFPDAEFVITHGIVVSGYENEIFFEAGNAMEIAPEVFPKLKLMVLGHIHDHGFIGETVSKVFDCVYPGSLTINNFGEVDERKGWVEVDLATLKYEWFEWPDDVTPWVHVELDLIEKDETSVDEAKLAKLIKGAIVKVTVFAKAHGVVNEAYIRQLFNKYGWVTRFETKVSSDGTEVSETPITFSHVKLLEDWLGDVDAKDAVKELALKMGKRIIEEVRG